MVLGEILNSMELSRELTLRNGARSNSRSATSPRLAFGVITIGDKTVYLGGFSYTVTNVLT